MTHECKECRYYLPTGEIFYNKPCGYCANARNGRRRVSDDKACTLFELCPTTRQETRKVAEIPP